MKILGVVCSPRKNGNTEILVNEALDAALQAGAETDIFLVSGKNLAPCDACGTCAKTGTCHIRDDMDELYPKLLAADGIIMGTPSYFLNVSAQCKIVMDRTFATFRQRALKDKVAGGIIAARRLGAAQVRTLLFSYFIGQKMLVAGGGIGYGQEKGDVRQGVGGSPNTTALDEARETGAAVVSLLKRLGKT